MYLNKAFVSGNLTRDVELKTTPNGVNIATFSVATNRVYTSNGERKEETEYHNIVVFGAQAENCSKYLKKGDQALVEGRIQTRNYEKDGVKHYRTEIIADNVQFGAKSPRIAGTDTPYPTDEGYSQPLAEDEVPF